eukprot:scaffold56227_cov39-Phaeocystis_antarctica.AAC.5
MVLPAATTAPAAAHAISRDLTLQQREGCLVVEEGGGGGGRRRGGGCIREGEGGGGGERGDVEGVVVEAAVIERRVHARDVEQLLHLRGDN